MKTKFLSLTFLLAFFMSLATPVVSQFLLSSRADAAPSATCPAPCDSHPVKVVLGSGSPQTYSCYPYMIAAASVPDTFASITSTYSTGPKDADFVSQVLQQAAGGAKDADQKATYNSAANSSNQRVMIGFKTENPLQNGGVTQCEAIGLLIQSSGGDSHTFYGLSIPPAGQFSVYNGAVNSLQTPGTVLLANYGSNPGITFKLNNYDASAFGTAGGGGAGDPNKTCVDGKFSNAGLNGGNGPAQTQACVNKYASGAQFLDAQRISFAGAIFTAASWTGSTGAHPKNDSMRYELTTPPTNDPDWIKSSQPSYLDIDTSQNISSTSGSGIDLNISGNDPASFANNITFANGHRANQVTAYFTNCVGDTCYSQNTDDHNRDIAIKVTLSGLSTFARYYPKGDNGKPEIQTIFTTGGTNETTYIGNYEQIDTNNPNRFVLVTNGPSGCNANSTKPYFDSLPASIATAPKGTLVTAPWQMNVGSDCTTFHQATVSLFVMAATDTPGEVNSTAAQCINDAGQTAPFLDADKQTCPAGYHLQGGTSAPTCEDAAGGLGWIMCIVIEGLAKAVDGIYTNFIVPLLQIPPLTSTGSNATPQAVKLKAAWASFRVFGNIILVIVVLVIVFGESIGGGMLDAYTLKKVIPRLLLAAIGINLSYYIVGGFLDITNIIGNGLRLLITAPFGVTGGNFDFSTVNGASQGGFLGIATLGGGVLFAAADGAAVASAAVWIIFTLLPMMLLLFLAIMGVLTLRLGLVYAIVMLSPVAFALWVLPNTEKYFKKWWELLQTTAMVFPIISGLFGISKVLSQATLYATGSFDGVHGAISGAASYIIVLILTVAPLAAIPFAFKLAGGIIGRAYDLANNARQQGNGYFKKRAERRKERMAKGTFFNPNSRLGQSGFGTSMNSALERNAKRAANENDEARGTRFAMTRRGARARNDALTSLATDSHVAHLDAVTKGLADVDGGDEDKTQARQESTDAHTGRLDTNALRQNLRARGKYSEDDIERTVARTERLRNQFGTTSFRLGSALSYLNNGTVGETANVEAMKWIADATHGDKQAAINVMLKGAEIAKAAGRVDLFSSSPTDNIAALQQVIDMGHDADPKGERAKEISKELLRKAKKTRSPGEMMMAKGDAIERFAPLARDDIVEDQQIVLEMPEYAAEQTSRQQLNVSAQSVRAAQADAQQKAQRVIDLQAQVTTSGGTTNSQQLQAVQVAIQERQAAEQNIQVVSQQHDAVVKNHKQVKARLESTPQHRKLMTDLARAQGLADIAGQVPEGKAAAYIDTLFSAGMRTGPKRGDDGNIVLDGNGDEVYEWGSIASMINSEDTVTNETYRLHHREWGDAQAQRAAGYQAAQAAGRGGPPGGIPTPGTP